MQKQETLSYADQFKDSIFSCSPFALRSTGIVQSQTSLKVDTYNLACVPYQISMGRVILLGAFSKEEIAFFLRFKNSLAALSITVQPASAREASKIFCRCQIATLGMMRGRDHVGLVVCDFKPIPPALETILGEHFMQLERLRVEWKDIRGKKVQITPESSRAMGFNNYAVATIEGAQHKLALFSLGVDTMEFLMPLRSPDMVPGVEASFNLFFQKYRFTVSGAIVAAQRLPTGVQKVRSSLNFSPELTDILSEYFFSSTAKPARS